MSNLFPGSHETNLINGQVYVPVDYDVGPDLITQIVNDSSPYQHYSGAPSYYCTNQTVSSESKVLCDMNSAELQDNLNKNGGEDNIVEMPINSNGVSSIILSDNQRPHTEFVYNSQPIVDLSTSIPEHVLISPTMLSEIKHIPTNVDFPGRHNFTFSIMEKSARNYSRSLNSVYLDIGIILPLHFRWQPLNLMDGQMFVRAMVMFSEPQHSQDIVVRCVHHAQPNDSYNTNVPTNMHSHVIRCKSKNTTYHGSVANNEHLSVLTALGLPQPGIDFVEVLYFFTCKNSCPSGINRKHINVVFTFETDQGVILGRKTIGAKICSCPKRDKEKDEAELKKRRNSLSRNLSRSRRVSGRKALTSLLNISNHSNNSSTSSMPHFPEDIYQMPPLPVYGRENYYRCLKYMFDLHAGEMCQRQVKEPYSEIMSTITKCMKEMETNRRPDPSTS